MTAVTVVKIAKVDAIDITIAVATGVPEPDAADRETRADVTGRLGRFTRCRNPHGCF